VGVGFVGNQVLESRSRKRPGKKKPVAKQALMVQYLTVSTDSLASYYVISPL
jgi:hypothetical protein